MNIDELKQFLEKNKNSTEIDFSKIPSYSDGIGSNGDKLIAKFLEDNKSVTSLTHPNVEEVVPILRHC